MNVKRDEEESILTYSFSRSLNLNHVSTLPSLSLRTKFLKLLMISVPLECYSFPPSSFSPLVWPTFTLYNFSHYLSPSRLRGTSGRIIIRNHGGWKRDWIEWRREVRGWKLLDRTYCPRKKEDMWCLKKKNVTWLMVSDSSYLCHSILHPYFSPFLCFSCHCILSRFRLKSVCVSFYIKHWVGSNHGENAFSVPRNSLSQRMIENLWWWR